MTHLARDWRALLAAATGRLDLHTLRRHTCARHALAHITRSTP